MLGVRRLCCPAWVPWCAQLIIVPLWAWITYDSLLADQGSVRLGVRDWALASFVLVVISLFLFLVGYRKLPAPEASDER